MSSTSPMPADGAAVEANSREVVYQWTDHVPEHLFTVAAKLDDKRPITEERPVLAISLDDAILQLRQALFSGEAVNKESVASIIAQHMQEEDAGDVTGSPSLLVFRGDYCQYQAALNALCLTPWVRPIGGQHVGKAWGMVSPSVILALATPFNA